MVMRALMAVVLCFAHLVCSAPAEANGSDPAFRFRVVELAPGDWLNVREQPRSSGRVIGSLARGAGNVIVTGAVVEVGGGTWWEIVFNRSGRSTGWVDGRFLAPDGGHESGYPLLCTGTEPFWSLNIAEGRAHHSTPEQRRMSMRASPWMEASGTTGRFAVELQRRGGTGYASVWREHGFCSDGMSDIRYPFGTIFIRPDGGVFAGCCRRSG
jgi:uncharacterized membrane protein